MNRAFAAWAAEAGVTYPNFWATSMARKKQGPKGKADSVGRNVASA
jgi:hypothetical protein